MTWKLLVNATTPRIGLSVRSSNVLLAANLGIEDVAQDSDARSQEQADQQPYAKVARNVGRRREVGTSATASVVARTASVPSSRLGETLLQL